MVSVDVSMASVQIYPSQHRSTAVGCVGALVVRRDQQRSSVVFDHGSKRHTVPYRPRSRVGVW